jgi:hypothetical protein
MSLPHFAAWTEPLPATMSLSAQEGVKAKKGGHLGV